MILRFATKRDKNGNRKYLMIDTTAAIYATAPIHWYCRADFVEIGAHDRAKLLTDVVEHGYTRIDAL